MCTLREGEPATAVTHGALDPRPYISFFLDVEFFDGVETPDVTVTVSDLVLHTAMAAELEMYASPGKGYEDYESSVATCTADVPRSTEGEVLTLTIGECTHASKQAAAVATARFAWQALPCNPCTIVVMTQPPLPFSFAGACEMDEEEDEAEGFWQVNVAVTDTFLFTFSVASNFTIEYNVSVSVICRPSLCDWAKSSSPQCPVPSLLHYPCTHAVARAPPPLTTARKRHLLHNGVCHPGCACRGHPRWSAGLCHH